MHFALANPCENTICKTLRKMYLLLAPHPRLRPGPEHPLNKRGHPQCLQTLRHHDPQTHLKRSLPLLCLPQKLHYPGMQPTYEEIQLHSCFKSM